MSRLRRRKSLRSSSNLIEPTETGYSAYSPDVPGCVATAPSRDEIEEVMRDAIVFHLEGLRANG